MTSTDLWIKLKISVLIETDISENEEVKQSEGKILNFTIEIRVNRNRNMLSLFGIIQKLLVKIMNQFDFQDGEGDQRGQVNAPADYYIFQDLSVSYD